jgi:hypothetical protein
LTLTVKKNVCTQMITAAPLTLTELNTRLRDARDEYELCSYIDHYPDVVRCRERHQREIDRIKKEIAEIEAREPRP